MFSFETSLLWKTYSQECMEKKINLSIQKYMTA